MGKGIGLLVSSILFFWKSRRLWLGGTNLEPFCGECETAVTPFLLNWQNYAMVPSTFPSCFHYSGWWPALTNDCIYQPICFAHLVVQGEGMNEKNCSQIRSKHDHKKRLNEEPFINILLPQVTSHPLYYNKPSRLFSSFEFSWPLIKKPACSQSNPIFFERSLFCSLRRFQENFLCPFVKALSCLPTVAIETAASLLLLRFQHP